MKRTFIFGFVFSSVVLVVVGANLFTLLMRQPVAHAAPGVWQTCLFDNMHLASWMEQISGQPISVRRWTVVANSQQVWAVRRTFPRR